MNTEQTKHQRKLFLIFIAILVTTVVFVVGTYAWFVGISTVNVGDFSVTISSSIGLELSIDGETWETDNLTINTSNINRTYNGNTNRMPSNGLIPLSTNGMVDSSVSRLKLYEEISLASSNGGYGLVADRVSNTGAAESDGYMVFDLFVRNGRGQAYDNTDDVTGAEEIYLTPISNAVKYPASDTNHGVINSLRVGFFVIGRLKADGYVKNNLLNITCSGVPNVTATDFVSGCSTDQNLASRRGYTWNIWEPSHDSHTGALVTYFNNVCKNRDSSNSGAYTSTPCSQISSSSVVNTYAVNSRITASDNVDIYDGLNQYTSAKLTEMITYKTSDALVTSNTKVPLLKLAGNSVSKVRIYVWLEGQDIDNYDLITGDSGVKINFGLTKDKFALSNS